MRVCGGGLFGRAAAQEEPTDLAGQRQLNIIDKWDSTFRIECHGISTAAAQKVWDVEKDKRHAHKAEAPLEPVPVAAHPIEHGHWGTLETFILG